ncbi:sugar ABC transporter permease [Varibaculum cambriense]|uniref:carbohydrate ABC transporter permease n=1 Tax=Varibaculum cambriense TaxID=184870 RepID=UPI0029046551|nr:sugar ABC transporter permease [Varibaculum cambriense]MDU1683499.1 sugar ABC transporter permease [Varibaculum cambriense]MDU2149748.1 sugar ABC transporter permease [Varibaculum cambriense]MDU7412916.1 sugar ABC transporter permease [Varibaculum cambriense]
MNWKQRERRAYWLYLIPMVVGFSIIVLIPLAANVFISLFSWKGGRAKMKWVGLENYFDLLRDPLFWSSFLNTIYMVIAIAIIPTIIGLILASTLFDFIGRNFNGTIASFLRATYYVPQILPVAVAGVLWSWILNTRDGALNQILRSVGIDVLPDWLGSTDLALYSIMLMMIWLQIGYPVVIFMSGLQRVEPSLYEAAQLDGAGWWKRFQNITIPSIRADIFVVILTATIGAMKLFAPVMVLTRGGPELSTYVPSFFSYRNFFELSRVGYGAASATVLALTIFVIAGGLVYWQSKAIEEG